MREMYFHEYNFDDFNMEVKRADTYFESIAVKLDTETRIPQNRKKQ